MNLVLDIAGGVLIATGALLSTIAAFGLLRLRDALERMHAGSKPQTLGLLLLVAGLALVLRDPMVTGILALIALLQLLAAPVAAQMIARAAYRTGQYRADELAVREDE